MLTKCVNGEVVEMSPEEEADIRAFWDANLKRQPTPQRLTDGALAELLVSKGLLTTAEVDAAAQVDLAAPI